MKPQLIIKEVSVDADGNLVFGKTVGKVTEISGFKGDLSTETGYGDYQLDITGLRNELTARGVSNVNAVVVNTKEGSSYGMRHLENIWRVEELAWSTGFTTTVHNCPTSSAHYEAMMGQTITSVTYYTDKGMFSIPLSKEVYVPVKFNCTFNVENASVDSGEAKVTLKGLPDGYDAEYSVKGLEDVKVENGKLTYKKDNAKIGKYTLTVSDKKHKYADITATFTLTTDATPITYDSEKASLVTAEGYTADDLAAYVKSIESVTVDGTPYQASGRGAVKIIKEDGSIDATAKPFANAKDGQKFEIVVKATGYAKIIHLLITLQILIHMFMQALAGQNTGQPKVFRPQVMRLLPMNMTFVMSMTRVLLILLQEQQPIMVFTEEVSSAQL